MVSGAFSKRNITVHHLVYGMEICEIWRMKKVKTFGKFVFLLNLYTEFSTKTSISLLNSVLLKSLIGNW